MVLLGEETIEGLELQEIIDMMYLEERKGAADKCTMAGDLLSYNILCNEKYVKLGELKKLLDSQKH